MMKEILTTLTPQGRKMFVAGICGFTLYYLSSVAMVLTTLAAIIDVLEGGGRLWVYALVLVGLLIFKTVASIWADKQKHCAGFDLVFHIRQRVVTRLKQLPLGYYTKSRLGEISEIIHTDVDTMEMIVGHLWTRMIADFVVSTIVLIGFAIYCWPLALLMISTLPFAIAYLVWGLKHAQRLEKTTGDAAADMSSLFVEYVRGMPVLKAFSRSRVLDDSLKDSVDRFAYASGRAAKNRAFVLSIYGFIMNLSLVMLVTGGLLLSLYGVVDILTFLVFVIVSVEFFKPFSALETHWMYYLKCVDSYQRINSITKAPLLPEPITPAVPKNGQIVFDRVSFAYSHADTPALHNVSLCIPDGTIAALVGSSGAGKSTITSLLLRFWDVTEGSIRIGGADVRDIASDDLLENISIVMQNVFCRYDCQQYSHR
ncbi:MAG: ABC transporter ATP-binding protein [Actinomycetaceae bacterium]|nr:ABC transporter ATP-binding protein [Actinomycetaceae bacterium]